MNHPKYVFDLTRALELKILKLEETPGDAPQDQDEPVLNLEDAFRRFLTSLPKAKSGSVSQRDMLRYIQQQKAGTTVSSMAQHFKVSGMSIGGVLTGGLERNIAKAGLELESIIKFEKEGGEWHLYPGPFLQQQPPVA